MCHANLQNHTEARHHVLMNRTQTQGMVRAVIGLCSLNCTNLGPTACLCADDCGRVATNRIPDGETWCV